MQYGENNSEKVLINLIIFPFWEKIELGTFKKRLPIKF
jgi:hypothetical protein